MCVRRMPAQHLAMRYGYARIGMSGRRSAAAETGVLERADAGGAAEVSGGRSGRSRLCAVPGTAGRSAHRGEAAEGLRRPLEIVANDDGSTYRGVYTVRFAETIYVLHAFQKKSRK